MAPGPSDPHASDYPIEPSWKIEITTRVSSEDRGKPHLGDVVDLRFVDFVKDAGRECK